MNNPEGAFNAIIKEAQAVKSNREGFDISFILRIK
jgi:hypothetical protein